MFTRYTLYPRRYNFFEPHEYVKMIYETLWDKPSRDRHFISNNSAYTPTRMHSSRMRTSGCSNHLGGCLPLVRGVSARGRVSAQGCLPWKGVSAGGCLPQPPLNRMTDTCENIPLLQLHCSIVTSHSLQNGKNAAGRNDPQTHFSYSRLHRLSGIVPVGSWNSRELWGRRLYE